MNTKKRRIGFGLAGILVVLVGGLMFAAIFQAVASARDLRDFPPPGQLIDVGTHRLHINCQGTGSPTVVLEAGMSGWSLDWALVQPDVAKETRVCAYDRAGYGWSEEGPRPRTSQQVVTELHTLLLRAGLQGRYILVGHSLGGLDVQLYASQYPSEIAGLVLVDSVHREQSLRMEETVRQTYEGNLKTLTQLASWTAPFGVPRLSNQPVTIIADKLPGEYQAAARALGFQARAYSALADEMAAFNDSQLEVRQAGPLPDVPLTVISSTAVRDFPPGFSADHIKQVWDELQADLAGSSPQTIHLIAHESGHYIHLDQPALVVGAVLEMVKKTRNSQ